MVFMERVLLLIRRRPVCATMAGVEQIAVSPFAVATHMSTVRHQVCIQRATAWRDGRE
jgi:hypothetical protein